MAPASYNVESFLLRAIRGAGRALAPAGPRAIVGTVLLATARAPSPSPSTSSCQDPAVRSRSAARGSVPRPSGQRCRVRRRRGGGPGRRERRNLTPSQCRPSAARTTTRRRHLERRRRRRGGGLAHQDPRPRRKPQLRWGYPGWPGDGIQTSLRGLTLKIASYCATT